MPVSICHVYYCENLLPIQVSPHISECGHGVPLSLYCLVQGLWVQADVHAPILLFGDDQIVDPVSWFVNLGNDACSSVSFSFSYLAYGTLLAGCTDDVTSGLVSMWYSFLYWPSPQKASAYSSKNLPLVNGTTVSTACTCLTNPIFSHAFCPRMAAVPSLVT